MNVDKIKVEEDVNMDRSESFIHETKEPKNGLVIILLGLCIKICQESHHGVRMRKETT